MADNKIWGREYHGKQTLYLKVAKPVEAIYNTKQVCYCGQVMCKHGEDDCFECYDYHSYCGSVSSEIHAENRKQESTKTS